MFDTCQTFNQDIGGWDVSSGKKFQGMFKNCYTFNKDIKHWNVSKVDAQKN